jgi:hypothetical protein
VQVGTLHFGGLNSDGSVANVEYKNPNLLGGDLGLTEYPQWDAQSKIQIQGTGTVTVFPGSTANTSNGPDVPASFTSFTPDGRIFSKAPGRDVIRLNELQDDNPHGLIQKASLNIDDDSTVIDRGFVDGTSTKTVFDTGTEPWSSETAAFDAYQRLQSQRVVLDGGGQQVKEYDPNNTHPYNELDVSKDSTGKVTTAQVVLDQRFISAGVSIGQIFGSALGSALAGSGQLGKLVGGVAGGAIGSLIGQKFAQVVATSLTADLSKVSLADVFAGQNLNIAGAGIGAVSSFLTAELGNALQIPGFGGQLFNAAANGFTLSVLSQVTSKITAGLTFEAAVAAIDWSGAVSGAIGAAGLHIDNLLGSYLGQLLVPAKSHAGAVGGQLLGAIGSFLLPGIGSLLGTILGTVIFDAFGNTPHPAATDLLDQAEDHYGVRNYQSFEGGSYDVPDQMAVPALAIINGYLSAVKGAALDHSKQVTLGYQTDPSPSYIVGVPDHPAAAVFFMPGFAVQAAALDVLQHTEVIGGDLLLTRAHQNSNRLDRNRNRGATGQRPIRGSGWRPAKGAAANMACIQKRFA